MDIRVFFSKILDQGTSRKYPSTLNRKIRLSNTFSLIAGISTFIGAFNNLIAGEFKFALAMLVLAGFWLTFIPLNRSGRNTLVRFLQTLMGHFAVLVIGGIAGPNSGIQYVIIALLIVPFALFELKQYKLIILLVSVLVIVWVVLEFNNYQIIDASLIKMETEFMYYSCFVASVSLQVMLLSSFLWSNTNSENKMLEIVSELEHKEVELLQRNHQLKTARDVLFENQLKLNEAKQIAEKAAIAKTNFLSNMSHEIRTPMNAVIGITEYLLSHGNLGKTERENLETIQYSADNLLVIINDILDFSKIDAGKLSLEKASFDLYKLILELTKTLHFKAAEKGVLIQNELGANVPVRVIGDAHRLNQVLLNLAGNALKFTKEGVVIVSVKEVDRGGNRCRLRFEVEDTGIGIPKDKQERIFDNFSQATESTTREYGGTGLGLAISRALVRLMGGELGVTSEVGVGSTFYFEIDVQLDLASEQRSELSNPSVKEIVGLEVLMVEDYKMNQIVAQQFLNTWGMKVTIAENGEEALAKTWEKKFDVILMDIQMPIMDGYDATLNIRANINNPNRETPIIALTANAFEQTREKALKTGMQDFVSKPFDKDILYEKLSIWALEKIKIS